MGSAKTPGKTGRAGRREKTINNKSRKSNPAMLGNNDRSKNKYSYTVDFVHRKNQNIKRLREINRQYRIMPFKGLKEVLMKKVDLDDLESVKSDEFKDLAQIEREKKMGAKRLKNLKSANTKLTDDLADNRAQIA